MRKARRNIVLLFWKKLQATGCAGIHQIIKQTLLTVPGVSHFRKDWIGCVSPRGKRFLVLFYKEW
jgi:hypothetical protein